VRQANAGPSAARNRGLREAACDLVAFLDADDLMGPDRLQRQQQALQADAGALLCHTAVRFIDASGSPLPGQEAPRDDPLLRGEVTDRLFKANFVSLSSVMLRRQPFLDCGAFDEGIRYCEDYEAWLRLSVRGRFAYLPQPLVSYRLHPHQATRHEARLNVGRIQARELFLQRCPEAARAVGEPAIRATMARAALDLGYASLRAGDLGAARWILRRGLAHAPLSGALISTLAKSFLPAFVRRRLGQSAVHP
jgi:glycosyltransferase involved in cell wall biosynthesis